MKKYAGRIARNEVDPHVRYDNQTSGLILDPLREEIPLDILGFGIYRLGPEFVSVDTNGDEVVLVPQDGVFEAEIDGKRFSGERIGGPFALGPGKSNASALYFPCDVRFMIRGNGEMAFFQAPAGKQKSPFRLSNEDVSLESRGDWVWRRDVVSLISPKNASSNLVVGETYSPPGFWSGTPLHRHDRNQPSAGESDQEEVYYHRFKQEKGKADRFGPYGVQLLMDGEGLMKAYLIADKSVFAIPGGCHPVVASPVSELLYLWGLAGKGDELAMKDMPEFVHLKAFENIFQELEKGRTSRTISGKKFRNLSRSFTDEQAGLLSVMLKEKGYKVK
jgi:5-deoxy-glucuronate isomerase